MAKEHVTVLTCPVCQKKSEFIVTDSIDLDADALQTAKIMNLSAFRHTCPDCGSVLPVRFPMFCISRKLALAAVLLTDRFDLKTLSAVARPANDLKMRAILSADRLRELILIFQNGLDDRAMVLTELAMKKMMSDNKVKASELYFTGLEETDSGKQLLFHAEMPSGPASNASWPIAFYEKMCSTFTGTLPEADHYRIFDEIWAKKLLMETVDDE